MDTLSTRPFIQSDGSQHTLNALVDGLHCPSCVAIIEGALKKQSGITRARLNLSTRRLQIGWLGDAQQGDHWIELINGMGYKAVPFDPDTAESKEQREEKFLLRCLAVAGFASGNLMLFSVPIWSSDSVQMGEGTRTMFYWIQALIAIPALYYCGRPFYRSAWAALKRGHTNMDVPISVAVILATLMSLFETANHGAHAYFDSGVMLLFFLLIGRYLDVRARGRARGAAHDLLKMMTGTATRMLEDGRTEPVALGDIAEGMVLRVAMGEKIPADSTVLEGQSQIDTSLLTGETLPQAANAGDVLYAGTLNIAAPLTVRANKPNAQSLLSDIIRLMETAEQGQARYVSIADRISHWYTPLVHVLAAVTFLGWWLWGATTWQLALLYAATVLIITCPCALGLAVPVVQVLASGRLMRSGILLKSGSALERLSEINHVVLDKTGTLTLGHPALVEPQGYEVEALRVAASMAAHSKHPLSQALVKAYAGELLPLSVKEVPGNGLEMQGAKLGKAQWCGIEHNTQDAQLELWLVREGKLPVRFCFADPLRSDAAAVVAAAQAAGMGVSMLSGDRKAVVDEVAGALGIADAQAGLLPADKAARLMELKGQGRKVLMVGDGLNDAPSLALAHVSMSPASAIDITQNAADIVFQGEKLQPVLTSWRIARFAQALVRENFVLALLYNAIAIPMAVAGYVTPLIAAVAMSSSSLIVIANAMRLNRFRS